MSEEQREPSFKDKVKKYLPWVVGTAVAVAGVAAIVVCILNNNSEVEIPELNLKPEEWLPDLDEVSLVEEPVCLTPIKRASPAAPFEVDEHIRVLPKGYHPSQNKVEEMIRKGIEPADNITIVDKYLKNAS